MSAGASRYSSPCAKLPVVDDSGAGAAHRPTPAPLPLGLYEDLLTPDLADRLAATAATGDPDVDDLRAAEASDRLALHLSTLIRRAIDGIPETDRVQRGAAITRALGEHLIAAADRADLQRDLMADQAEVLRAVNPRHPDGSTARFDQPLTPVLDTVLLTNPRGEPALSKQLLSEIPSADRIDLIVAFIRYSGIRPMLDALRRHVEQGRELRILTTTYTGSTEARALEVLAELGAQIRVSYDTTTTRLHAKSWLFHRHSGASTAYIGSSNLTHSAQVAGLEWNVRVSGRRNPDVIASTAAVFESYWASGDFVAYDPAAFTQALTTAAPDHLADLPPFELTPHPFQSRLLERIEVARAHGRHRNLLVAATGTGKTVMAALDYARLRQRLPRARLLFVAHRKELLQQSLATFRHALREPAFGELWVDGERPTTFDHVFASIQSLRANGVATIDPGHFDVVIVDEFHHAAADSYDALLRHLQPVELLGLTATPERADGMPILHWFDDRIAAELRLWDAIDQHRLVPFAYYGIHDGTDLTQVTWRRGRGYDDTELTNLYTGDDAYARRVVHQLANHVSDPATMRALGFCVSKDHARFMARHFTAAGIGAVAVTADTPRAERKEALTQLRAGEVQVLFSVDLFSEGVDVPAVDTVLMLRPTQSGTVFLQQLGRGLRKSPETGKAVCTVLDFVGHHRREFRFDLRYSALLGGTRRTVERAVTSDFPYLPSGCHMQLDPVARQVVLESIRSAIPSTWPARVAELRRYAASQRGGEVTLAGYLTESGLDLEGVYLDDGRSRTRGKASWTDLKSTAGVAVAGEGPFEASLRHAVGRMTHVDDEVRLRALQRFARASTVPDVGSLDAADRALLRMLVVSLMDQVLTGDRRDVSLQSAVDLLWQHPAVLAEVAELMDLLSKHVDHVHQPLAGRAHIPLQVHAQYTRGEILAAMHQQAGSGAGAEPARVPEWREGVRWCADQQTDLFLITFDKSAGHFSPTTRYRDYAMGPRLLHWESQSTTTASSPTGQRYQNHVAGGSQVYLFARQDNTARAFYFLGPASYVRHEGDRPMAITWELTHPLPGDLLAAFAAVA